MSDTPSNLDLSELFRTGKEALQFFRTMRDLLPKGDKQDKAQENIENLDRAFQLAEAEIGKAFGYRMCQCTIPPTPMLYKHNIESYVCNNPECGRTVKSQERIMRERNEKHKNKGTWIDARRGR